MEHALERMPFGTKSTLEWMAKHVMPKWGENSSNSDQPLESTLTQWQSLVLKYARGAKDPKAQEAVKKQLVQWGIHAENDEDGSPVYRTSAGWTFDFLLDGIVKWSVVEQEQQKEQGVRWVFRKNVFKGKARNRTLGVSLNVQYKEKVKSGKTISMAQSWEVESLQHGKNWTNVDPQKWKDAGLLELPFGLVKQTFRPKSQKGQECAIAHEQYHWNPNRNVDGELVKQWYEKSTGAIVEQEEIAQQLNSELQARVQCAIDGERDAEKKEEKTTAVHCWLTQGGDGSATRWFPSLRQYKEDPCMEPEEKSWGAVCIEKKVGDPFEMMVKQKDLLAPIQTPETWEALRKKIGWEAALWLEMNGAVRVQGNVYLWPREHHEQCQQIALRQKMQEEVVSQNEHENTNRRAKKL